DLSTGKIAGIWNALSGRRIGDPSLLEDDPADYAAAPVLGPYEKTGPGGAHLKSVTAVLPGVAGSPAGLLCINLDVSHLEKAAALLAAFVTPAAQEQPPALFRRDWREAAQ